VEVLAYVRNNLDWIENIPRVGGYGSGLVEKTVDIALARRFKKRVGSAGTGKEPILFSD